MNIGEAQIRAIVEEVVKGIGAGPPTGLTVREAGDDGIFQEMEACIDAAEIAQRALMELTLEKRKEIIEAIRRVGVEYAEDFAQRTWEETGMGRVRDKVVKHHIAATLTPGMEDLETHAWSGDHGLTTVEMAPYGVIGAITPSTHPVPTMLNNAIGMIAAGNAVVFNHHPSAKKVAAYGLRRIHQGIVAAGGPPNLLTAVENPTLETGKVLFTHPKIRLLMVTGGPGVVKVAMASGKKTIAAGPGNPPVVVDETADIPKAARDIVAGAAFDNNILCIAEKEIFVVEAVADPFKQELLKNDCFELDRGQVDALAEKVFQKTESGHYAVSRKFVGCDAAVLAREIGVTVDPSVRLLIGETNFDHLFVQEEQMMPFLPMTRVRDVEEGIALAIRAEHGYGHTAIMHSRNVEHMSNMAKRVNTAIFVKNGASSAGLGIGGEGFTSLSIAGPTGEGITSARTFTRQRRCALVDYFRIV
ncbi:MAG: aldehyde dehydrogenase EutE [Candidatus Latescibacteria bacterium]|nr:aldehyde dehydrogenase EutE [Candidatus Latescibacterota bacterium]